MFEKYNSIHKLINLPEKRFLNPKENVFNNNNDNKYHHISNNIKDKRKEFIKQIQSELQIFNDVKYNFKFPLSKFDDVEEGRMNQMTYELKIEVENENTFKPKLNQKQIKQITENGEFYIQSNFLKTNIPYIWKINPYFVKGKHNINETWQNGLVKCYDLLHRAKILMFSTVSQSFEIITKIPEELFGLFFGKKNIVKVYTVNYDLEVHIDFWTDILNEELKDITNEIGHEFLDLLNIPYEYPNNIYNDNKELTKEETDQIKKKTSLLKNKQNKANQLVLQLQQIESQFQQNWLKIRKTVIAKAEAETYQQTNHEKEYQPHHINQESNNFKDTLILEKVEQEKFLLYTAHIKEYIPKCNVSMQAVEALIHLTTILYFISTKLKLKQNKLEQIYERTKDSIKKKHPIRSRNLEFLEREIQKIYEPYEKSINKDFDEHLFEDKNIKELINETNYKIYKKYLNFKNNYSKLIQSKKQQIKTICKPTIVLKESYELFRPFEVDESLVSTGFLKKFEERTITSKANFWKVSLFFMRLKCWTINCVVVLLKFAWTGEFGLRCLFGVETFVCDEWYNFIKKEKENIFRKTCIGHFKTILEGFHKSRENFEEMHDEGLLGKKFSGIFNFIECYIFRLLISGIIKTLILYPFFILVFFIVSIALILTVWIWVPLLLVLYYLFSIFIYQFEGSEIPSNITVFPIFYIISLVLINSVKIVLSTINFLIFTPIITFFYFISLVIHKTIRTAADFIFIFIISKVGRTPSKNTTIANKIAGPGMSRNHFYSIRKEHVYVLTQCCLEKILVRKFIDLTRTEIEKSTEKYESIMEYVLSPFIKQNEQMQKNRKNIVTTNKNSLLEHFNKKARQFEMRYPMYPKMVRFTQNEIDIYFENSIKITKNFVEKEQIKDWIFEERQIIYEDYEELTKSIWIEIFQCGQEIFKPLEMIDSRFELSNHTQNQNKAWEENVNQVMESLENEIELSQITPLYAANKKSLLENDVSIKCLEYISRSHHTFCNAELDDPRFLFLAPKNLNFRISESKCTRDQYLKLDMCFEI